MRSYKIKIILSLFIVILIFAFSFLIFGNWAKKKEAPNLDAFAGCLTDKGIVMYGAYWCPHCQSEKDAFGNSFQFVNYVECTEKPQECLAKGIDGYPTWILADGTKLVGEQGVKKLREISGCPYNPKVAEENTN